MSNYNPPLAAEIAIFNSTINVGCNQILKSGGNKIEAAKFINNEIKKILEKDIDAINTNDEAKIIYATTYKYSMFYWILL